ncbi:MAG: sarcosine oxidase subunit gamma [Pseudomonadota bacterium]
MPEPALLDALSAPAAVGSAPAAESPIPRDAAAPRRLGPATGETGVSLSQAPFGTLWQVTAWPGALDRTAGAVGDLCGAFAPGPGAAAGADGVTALRIEPLRWLILSEGPLPAPSVASDVGTALDLSHARWRVRVSGARRAELLARLAPIDWRKNAFPEGAVATTPIHHIAITVYAEAESFALLLPRSYAASLWDDLVETASSLGVEIA